ncbi:MAG: EAL domain-containing protein [Longimicrobiales bacterium]
MSPVVVLAAMAFAAVAAWAVILSVRHRRLNERLELRRTHVGELFESSADAVILIDRKGRVKWGNDAFSELFGYSRSEFDGTDIDELLIPPGELAEAKAATARLISGEPVRMESMRRRKDGVLLSVSIISAPITFSDADAVAFVIYRDITRQLLLETAFLRLEKAVETMQIGVTVTDLDGRIVYCNPADAAMHGYTSNELIGKHARIFALGPGEGVVPKGRRTTGMTVNDLHGMTTWRREGLNVRKDGSEFSVHLMSDVVKNSDGEPIGMVTTCEDITVRRLAEKSLQESEARYALAVQGGNDGLWDWNLQTDKMHYSQDWARYLGYGPHDIGDSPDEWLTRIHEEDIERVKEELALHRRGGTPRFQSEHRLRHRDGSYRWIVARGIAERDERDRAIRMVGSITDFTERKSVEAQLTKGALYDSLTGLPNRAFFIELLDRSFNLMKRRAKHTEKYQFAILFIDLDRFKVINDTLGHAAGDELLVELSRRFLAAVRPGDVVSRIGGDEFCILLDGIKDSRDSTRVSERILDALRDPVDLESREIFPAVSIGIAVSEPGMTDPDQLLRNADAAMYRVKESGSGRYEVFDRRVHERAVMLLKVEADLKMALHSNQLRLDYQPIVSLSDGRVRGFEALIRWDHPEQGVVSPELFVPLAEETGLIVPMGWWVIREASTQMAEWVERFPELADANMSVNLAAKQIQQPDLVDRVTTTLQDVGLDPERLTLEISEVALLEDPAHNARVVHRLRDLGVQVEIDDFGTGYSSLSYLSDFRVSSVKIDRTFINKMGANGSESAVVEAVITLARGLGLRVAAEGVETDEQSTLLKELQCDDGQGFFYSHPLSPEKVIALLEAQDVEVQRASG